MTIKHHPILATIVIRTYWKGGDLLDTHTLESFDEVQKEWNSLYSMLEDGETIALFINDVRIDRVKKGE